MTTLVYGSVALIFAYLLNWAVQTFYSAFISPLKQIPGPWWSPITAFPKDIAMMSKRQVHFYHDLTKEYGSFVRAGPKEVIVNDVAAFKQIHRIGTPFIKSDFYKILNPTEPGTGPYTLFSTTDNAEHAKRRKLLARGFTQQFLRSNWEDVVHAKIEDAVQLIKAESAKNGEADMLKWWLFMAGDIISELMLGESFGSLQLGKKTDWFVAMQTSTQTSVLFYLFPLLYYTLKWTPIPAVQKVMSTKKALMDQGETAVKNSRASANTRNIFANVLEQADKDDPTMTDREVVVEAGSFIFAGTDTTANTLTYTLYNILSDPALRDALEKELAAVDEPYTDSKLEPLPVLNAVIKETLRLFGAAPGALPRVSPQEGAQLGEYFIPGGTIVATQAWSMHRDPKLFPNPEKFDYTRWLPSAKMSEETKAAFHPFGAGSRICIGLHLAYMELRLATAIFLRECKGARLAPSVTPESMEVENIFLISPKAKECRVIV